MLESRTLLSAAFTWRKRAGRSGRRWAAHARRRCCPDPAWATPPTPRLPVRAMCSTQGRAITHQDLVKDLVEARHKADVFEHHAVAVVHPQLLLLLLRGPDVGVGAQQDVLQLRAAREVRRGEAAVTAREQLGAAAVWLGAVQLGAVRLGGVAMDAPQGLTCTWPSLQARISLSQDPPAPAPTWDSFWYVSSIVLPPAAALPGALALAALAAGCCGTFSLSISMLPTCRCCLERERGWLPKGSCLSPGACVTRKEEARAAVSRRRRRQPAAAAARRPAATEGVRGLGHGAARSTDSPLTLGAWSSGGCRQATQTRVKGAALQAGRGQPGRP